MPTTHAPPSRARRATLPQAQAYFTKGGPAQGDPKHTRGLCIAGMVLSIVEAIIFGVSFNLGAYLFLVGGLMQVGGVAWTGLAVCGGLFISLLNFALAAAQLVFHDRLMALGRQQFLSAPPPVNVVVNVALQA